METRNKAGRGELLPDVALPATDGRQIRFSDYRGRSNLVLFFGGALEDKNLSGLLEEVANRYADFGCEEAEVILISSKDPAGRTPLVVRADWRFVVLIDADGRAHRKFNAVDDKGASAPAVFVADRYGEIFAEYHAEAQQELPGIDELIEWLFFINSQCPECGVPDEPS